MARITQPVEARLLAEYLAAAYPGYRTLQHTRVGPLHPELDLPYLTPDERRMVGVWRRWVDAVIVRDRDVLLVEASVLPRPAAVAQLEVYLRLWPRTPEYPDLTRLPARGLLVSACDDPEIRMLCRARDYLNVVYRPRWVDAYLATLAPRQRRPPLAVP